MRVTYWDVIDSFHANVTDRYPIPEELEHHWFQECVAWFELELYPLSYDEENREFTGDMLPPGIGYVLGMMMYTRYLTREFSRISKLAGISTKDISIPGGDTAKRVVKQELDDKLALVRELMEKYKTPSAVG